MVDVDTLRQTEIFSHLEISQLKTLQPSCEVRKIEPGQIIFHAGDKADTLYVLLDGVAVIRFDTDRLEMVMVTFIDPGKSFGWSSLVAPNRYTNTAECPKASRVLAVKADGLRELMRHDPGALFSIMQDIIATLSSRLRDAQVQLYEALELIERLGEKK